VVVRGAGIGITVAPDREGRTALDDAGSTPSLVLKDSLIEASDLVGLWAFAAPVSVERSLIGRTEKKLLPLPGFEGLGIYADGELGGWPPAIVLRAVVIEDTLLMGAYVGAVDLVVEGSLFADIQQVPQRLRLGGRPGGQIWRPANALFLWGTTASVRGSVIRVSDGVVGVYAFGGGLTVDATTITGPLAPGVTGGIMVNGNPLELTRSR
jgi:hypothetical protein